MEKIKENSESLEGKNIAFRTEFDEESPMNRTQSVHIRKEKEYLGSGSFSSKVSLVEASVVTSSGEESPVHDFVIKKYHTNDPIHYVERAMKNWKAVKLSGARTWDTYRVSEDSKMIIMTNGNSDEKTVLTSNTNEAVVASQISEKRFMEIKNFDLFLKRLYEDLVKVSKKRIELNKDSIGLLFDNHGIKKSVSDIDYIFADMDMLKVLDDNDSETVKDILIYNMWQIKFGLIKIIEKYVESVSALVYTQEITEFFRDKNNELQVNSLE